MRRRALCGVAFHYWPDGESLQAALGAAIEAATEAIALLEEQGRPIPEPLGQRSFSGVMSLRIPPDTHKLVATSAAHEGISINQFVTSLIERNLFANRIAHQVNELSEAVEWIKTLARQVQNQAVVTVMDPSTGSGGDSAGGILVGVP